MPTTSSENLKPIQVIRYASHHGRKLFNLTLNRNFCLLAQDCAHRRWQQEAPSQTIWCHLVLVHRLKSSCFPLAWVSVFACCHCLAIGWSSSSNQVATSFWRLKPRAFSTLNDDFLRLTFPFECSLWWTCQSWRLSPAKLRFCASLRFIVKACECSVTVKSGSDRLGRAWSSCFAVLAVWNES